MISGSIIYYLLILIYTASYNYADQRFFIFSYILLLLALVIMLMEFNKIIQINPIFLILIFILFSLPYKELLQTLSMLEFRAGNVIARMHEPSLIPVHEFKEIFIDEESIIATNSIIAYSTTGSRNIMTFPGKDVFIKSELSEIVDVIIIDKRIDSYHFPVEEDDAIITTVSGKVFDLVYQREDKVVSMYKAAKKDG
jgi:hypothetical protein